MSAKNPFDLSGRVAVVTGGNGGLGFGMAETLAKCGATVSIWGRNADKNARSLEALKALGADVSVEVCDVTDRASVDACFASTLKRHGRVDGMFANAGRSLGRKSFVERGDDDWDAIMKANVYGVVYSFQAAARHMMERAANGDKFGRLVVTSSVASIDGAAGNDPYGASKAGVNGLVRATAVELARYGVTVNAILPGYAISEMTEKHFENEKFTKAVMPRIPARRFGEPSDYGGVAAYFLSEGSSYMTGQCLVLDGGYTIF